VEFEFNGWNRWIMALLVSLANFSISLPALSFQKSSSSRFLINLSTRQIRNASSYSSRVTGGDESRRVVVKIGSYMGEENVNNADNTVEDNCRGIGQDCVFNSKLT
jgi:hypothetical protein